jgi:hypothetical protein
MLLNVMHATVFCATTKKHLLTVNTTSFNKQVLFCKNKCYQNPFYLLVSSKGKGKGKVHTITDHEGPEVE